MAVKWKSNLSNSQQVPQLKIGMKSITLFCSKLLRIIVSMANRYITIQLDLNSFFAIIHMKKMTSS